MCGIAGIISLNTGRIEPESLKKMCDSIIHRGPDDSGYVFFQLGQKFKQEGGYWCAFTDPEFKHVNENLPVYGGTYFNEEISKHCFSIGLGHRRLSIIDLTHYGHQPMPSSDRRYWVVFNGEIYNFPDLKKNLYKKGHIFRTRTDTEVLLHLWEEYQSDCLGMLNGMFAFCVYDRINNTLTLARDRFGVKPLYYTLTKNYLIFASEIKAILACKLTDPKIEHESLVEYFTFQNLYGNNTLFENVHLIRAGEYLEVTPGFQNKITFKHFHTRFPCADPALYHHDNLIKEISNTFSSAVKSQLISDVEVGSYLSGGMDSGAIVSVASSSLPRLMTFTGGFDLTNVDGIEQGYDERNLAEQLSHLLQTEHYAVVLHAGDMPAAMEKITWHIDDPRIGMCHQNWYVAKLASKFVKVCLAGAGGDELFAGYPWRYLQGIHASNFEEFDSLYFDYWHRLLPKTEINKLFLSDASSSSSTAWESFKSVMDSAPKWREDLSTVDNILQRALYFEFKTFLHGFLIIEDHISMAHGLETRVPFLDNTLADLSWQIPPSLKLKTHDLRNNKNVYIESAEGKSILRHAMQEYLPVEFLHQPKQGFSPPDENWYRGPSMEYIKDILYDSHTMNRNIFNQKYVVRKLEEHFNGIHNNRLLIWSLLCTEWLYRHFID